VVSQVAGAIEKEMIDAVDRSDLPTAIAAHRRLAPLVEAIMTRMPGAVSAKAALTPSPGPTGRGDHDPYAGRGVREGRAVPARGAAPLRHARSPCRRRRPAAAGPRGRDLGGGRHPARGSRQEAMMTSTLSHRLNQPPKLRRDTLRVTP